jgi:hypothetical protein
MASLDDILTTQKNGVTALNGINSINAKAFGTITSSTVTGATLVVSGSGRLINFSIVVAGSAVGGIYNQTTISGPIAANQLVATPTTIGVYQSGQFFTNGLVIAPGTGQSINVTYSQ